MPFSGKLTVAIDAQMTGSLDLERLTSSIQQSWVRSLGDGTGADQAQRFWSDTRTLASGASETLDVNGNTLKDAFGANITFTKVKAYVIISDRANTTDLTIGNVANGIADPFGAATGGIVIHPGGQFVITAPDANGMAAAAGTADLLKIANAAGAPANYDVLVIGVS